MAENKEDLHLRSDGSSADDDEWDLDIIQEAEGGLVVFDGGSYSRGPLRLGDYIVPSCLILHFAERSCLQKSVCRQLSPILSPVGTA